METEMGKIEGEANPYHMPKTMSQGQALSGDSEGTRLSIDMSSRRVEVIRPDEGQLKKTGMRIVFKDLSYTVTNSSNRKETLSLLKNITGYMEPAKMCALMGPSGSGKTTLLDVLAGRKTQGTIHGDILFAGRKPSIMFLRRFTGYVEQFDTLMGTLTVREMLLYTAELKRPMSEPFEEKARAVDDMISKLALDTCKDTLIGTDLARGISGGQAKRTNIGIAMVTNPRVLFLDEPTSGLDSFTANDVMRVVKGLIADGTTICATIHSPTQFAFRLFDNIMLLVRGEMVYFGENGKFAISYFQNLPGVQMYNEGENEAEWITDIITSADRQGFGSEFAEKFQSSEMSTQLKNQVVEYEKEGSNISADMEKSLNVKRATVTPFWFGLKTLFKYRTTRNYRDPAFLGPRLGDKIIMSLIIMSLYWGIGNDVSDNDSSQVPNISAVLFMWCTLPAFGAASYVPAIVLERPLYVRERNDGLYRSVTYLFAKMIDELMLVTVASVIFAAVVFFPIQLQGNFGIFWIVYLATLSVGIVLAYFVAALSPNMDVANAALPAYVVTLLFFAGFLITFREMPDYWIWYSYLDFLRYAWSALMVNQFDDTNPVYLGGKTVMDFYEVDKQSIGVNIVIELCFFVFFAFCAWVALTYKKFTSR